MPAGARTTRRRVFVTNPPRRFRFWPFLTVAVLALAGCQSGRCESGELCECAGGQQCYLDCASDDCNQRCHDMPSCGAVCEDGCHFSCYRSVDCSNYCGAGCTMDCHDTQSCGTICGPGCSYSCRRADACGARVGSGSLVVCEAVGSCEVECEGECRVTCRQVGGSGCRVTCLGGGAPTSCGNGNVACGPC